MVHIQGRLRVQQIGKVIQTSNVYHTARYHTKKDVHIATLPPGARPTVAGMFCMVPKAGVWGDSRVEIRVDGKVMVSPAYECYLPISFLAARPSLKWQPLPYMETFTKILDTDRTTAVWRHAADGTVHIQGRIVLKRGHLGLGGAWGGGYIDVAIMPAGARPLVTGMIWEVAKVGVWGDARLSIEEYGVMRLKPVHSVYVPVSYMSAVDKKK